MIQIIAGGLIYILENINVENIIIGKQGEKNKNLKEIIDIINKKKINLIEVKSDEIKHLEKNIDLNFLWPNSKLIEKNLVNNNSLVFKLNYNNFSIFFAGDIEKEASARS